MFKIAYRDKRGLSLLLGLLLFSLVLVFLDLDPDKPAMTMTLAVTVLMAVWWVTEAVPIGVTSLLPIALFPIMGILDGKTVSSNLYELYCFSISRWFHAGSGFREMGSSP